jgi:hypothetical protein
MRVVWWDKTRDAVSFWLYRKIAYFFGELYDYFLTKELYVGARCRRCKGMDGMHRRDCNAR